MFARMFVVEAMWLAEKIAAIPDGSIGPVLNIGSGNLAQRTVRYPEANSLLWGPLAERDVPVLHCDIKDEPGVDIVADLTTSTGRDKIAAVSPGLILCNSLYEHLRDPRPVADAITASLRPGGQLLVTVPHSYPYHADPIDTMFRPSPDVLAEMHPGLEVLDAKLLEASTWRFALGLRPRRIFRDGYNCARSVVATRSFRHTYPMWWNRPYVMTVACLRRPT